MARRALTVLLLTTAMIACRGGDDDDDNAGPDAAAAEVSIYEIQDGTVGDGAPVTLRGVVVTAIDAYGDDAGQSFWIAEPDDHPTYGRAYSGVQVYARDISIVAALAVGDLVDIEDAIVKEFALNCDTVDCTDTTNTLTEIDTEQGVTLKVTKVGTGTVPAAQVVVPQDLAADPTEAEKWEGVLVQFADVAATQAPRQVTSDTTLYEMRVTGPMIVQSAIAALPDVARDDCFDSVSGILSYFYAWKVLPLATGELVAAADNSACLYETSADDCDDGMDNDFDGFPDCQDFSCQFANQLLCSTEATVVEVQDGTIAENALVRLTDVVVTAVGNAGKDIFVQDAGGAADYNGLHIYRGSTPPTLDAQIVVGATIDVLGSTSEFGTPFGSPVSFETEIEVDPTAQDVTFKAAGAPPAIRTGIAVGTLADATNGEPYEGTLIELSNVSVSNGDAGFGEFIISDGTDELHVDDLLHKYTLPTTGTCYGTLRGVMAESFGDRKLLPRTAADMVPGAGCP